MSRDKTKQASAAEAVLTAMATCVLKLTLLLNIWTRHLSFMEAVLLSFQCYSANLYGIGDDGV